MDITSTRVSLRRRQEEESCPEEERPCLGLSGSKITLSAASTWRSAQNWCIHSEKQRNTAKSLVFVWFTVSAEIVVASCCPFPIRRQRSQRALAPSANLACLLCYVNVAVTLLAPVRSAHRGEKVPLNSVQKSGSSVRRYLLPRVYLTQIPQIKSFCTLCWSSGKFGVNMRHISVNFMTTIANFYTASPLSPLPGQLPDNLIRTIWAFL